MFEIVKSKVKHIKLNPKIFYIFASIAFILLSFSLISLGTYFLNFKSESTLSISKLKTANEKVQKELEELKSQDQLKINKELEEKIKNIEVTYKESVEVYEKIVDLRDQKIDTKSYDESLTKSLTYLSERNYSSASALLKEIKTTIDKDTAKRVVITAVGSTANITVNNTAPDSGYSRQKVKTDFGEFIVDIIAADLNSTRVIVDTASDSDCTNDCPVLSLSDYVGRNGAYAGINGSYFCPASYPSCAGKTNSFDTLLMNKNKKYFNSDNNVYSTVPAVIFSGNSARFVGRSLDWGRDTGVDAVLANQPLLVSGGNVVFGGDDEVKRVGSGSRSFVGSSGSTAYIGVIHSVNAAQMARVLHTMGIQNALNLDSGGSTALWSGGYKVGPGRNIPNALLFVRK